MNTGRIRDQWHTMTRSGRTARLLSHLAEPFIEIHPDDAARCGLQPAAIAHVESECGAAILRALVTERVQPGQVFAPIHWTDQFAAQARVDALVPPNTDAISGQPESKLTPVRVTSYGAAWYGFAIMRTRPVPPAGHYWAAAPVVGGWQIELAGRDRPGEWQALAARLFGRKLRGDDHLSLEDAHAGLFRLALFDGDRLEAAFFASREPVAVSRAWAVEQLSATFTAAQRLQVLAGRGGDEAPDRGAILCACENVGINEITAAIARGAHTLADIGAATCAGTNCGSCRAEIERLIDAYALQAAE